MAGTLASTSIGSEYLPPLPIVSMIFETNRSIFLPSATIIGSLADSRSSSRYSASVLGMTTPSEPESRNPSVDLLLLFSEEMTHGMNG